ncbi:MAG: prepilin peptidase [bacterium]|nr:prepilin peptidase [bacterium]
MIVIGLILFGLIFGSFVNALVWRMHEQEDKKSKVKKKDLSISHGRSMCVKCHHKLGFLDLIPVFSWLWLRGKCRYCNKEISKQYPLVELTTAALFGLSYYFWPVHVQGLQWAVLAVWLMSLVVLMALLVYDLKWMILPNKLVAIVSGLAFVYLILQVADGGTSTLINAFFGIIVTAGVFYAIFQISKGTWIGGGDVKLAVSLGIFAGSLLHGVLLLFLASLLGSLISAPLMFYGKTKLKTRIPFGPFLIAATVIVVLFGQDMIEGYERLVFIG